MKKIIILLLVIICITATATLAVEHNKAVAESRLSETIKNIIEEYVSNTSNLKSPDAFKSIVDCCDEAAIENIKTYIDFIYQNRFGYSELKVINRILENGTTIQSLDQVYKFWLTTDEDFEFIEDICILEDSYLSEFWFEKAFNKLTDYEHGMLTSEEILEYLSKGLTTDQIQAANVMSRKKGQNITNILNAHLEGNTLEKQAANLYGVTPDESNNSIFAEITKIACDSRKKKAYSVLDLSTDNAQKILNDVINSKVSKEFTRLGLVEKETTSTYSDNAAVEYPVSVQKAYLNKGYTPKEISKSKEFTNMSLTKAIKQAREVLKNEKDN